MSIVFWSSLGLLIYAFVFFPALLWLLARLSGRQHRRDEEHLPRVSMILSVYNEEAVIGDKIKNFLALDYPEGSMELVVVSDGCSDRTEDLVRESRSARVHLFVQPKRGGKTLALNRGVAEARGEILVFTDANSMFESDAVRRLVSPFISSEVGLVSGRSQYLDSRGRTENTGGAYRRYEDFIKEMESATVSIVGADGAIYAMRRELYEPLPPQFINDLLHPMQVVRKGLRAVQESGARCSEVLDSGTGGELRRQTRIMAQSWLIVLTQAAGILAAGRVGYFWALMSHKMLRWLTLPILGLLLASNVALCGRGLIYQSVLLLQAAFYAMALAGWRKEEGLLRIPSMFLMLHLAALTGLVRLATGQAYATWDPRRN
ncbi:MAG: glycosyltransferase family 2 protein [Desulfovibrionales bacterium]|nr:glycosyltransferase family 2 protein [Desulfovibrionales bacterium]